MNRREHSLPPNKRVERTAAQAGCIMDAVVRGGRSPAVR